MNPTFPAAEIDAQELTRAHRALAWLAKECPVALWEGNVRQGPPSPNAAYLRTFQVIKTNQDGVPVEVDGEQIILGVGRTLIDAIEDAQGYYNPQRPSYPGRYPGED